jgi:hypothetical protein
MTKAQKHCLVAAVALLSVILTPRSSHGGTISGSWTGAESYSVEIVTDGQLTGGYQASWVPTVLTIALDTVSGNSNITLTPTSPSYMGWGWNQDESTVHFGATSGSADIFGGGSEYYNQQGNFSFIYQGIAPDGEIIPLPQGGGAQGEVSGGFQNVLGTGASYSVEFFSVPEPPSIVQAFGGLLVVSVFWQLRAVSARRSGGLRPVFWSTL